MRKSITNVSQVGRTRWHELELNISNAEIDQFYREYREDLRQAIEWGDLIKNGRFMKAPPHAEVSGFMYLPTNPNCRNFTLQDITESKRIFKKHKKQFLRHFVENTTEINADLETINDWNDLHSFQSLLKRLRVKKPYLTARIIFGAWTHNNINVYPGLES